MVSIWTMGYPLSEAICFVLYCVCVFFGGGGRGMLQQVPHLATRQNRAKLGQGGLRTAGVI